MGVAETIREQIGPMAFLMMGTKKDIWKDGNSLIFRIRGSHWQKVKITLTPSDTYKVEFFKIHPKTFEVKSDEHTDVYVEDLHEVIERATGLYLSLTPRGR
jgi:hypothetical protein